MKDKASSDISSRENQNRKYVVFAGMGFELVGFMIVALYLGQEIDERYGTNGLAIAGLSMAALVAWMWHLIVLTKNVSKTNQR